MKRLTKKTVLGFLLVGGGLMLTAAPALAAGQFFIPQSQQGHVSLPAFSTQLKMPAPSVGVLSVPLVMDGSTAVQHIRQVSSARLVALREKAQHEREELQNEAKTLQAEEQNKTLPADVLKTKEEQFREKVITTQVKLREEAYQIQEAGSRAADRVDSVLQAVVVQIAKAMHLNLIVHRDAVLFNSNTLDITPEVTEQLNKALPSVEVPAASAMPLPRLSPELAKLMAQSNGN